MTSSPDDLENAAVLRAWVYQCARATKREAAKCLRLFACINSVAEPGEEIDMEPTRAKFDAAIELMRGCNRHAKNPLDKCFDAADWDAVFSGPDPDGIRRELCRRGVFDVPKFEGAK